tara:strand:- start:508 stop:732 length:225 start_codon:yes stop_codon:yes gene_type:complete
MPRYKTKVGKIIELPELSGKEMRALKLRRSVTVSELEKEAKARKARKKAGGVIKMRGGGIAKKGTASLSGYKVV